MKHGFKRITKTTIALILGLCMLITMAVPVMAAETQTLIDRATEPAVSGDEELKGEKIVGDDGKEFYRLDSMTEDQYAAFGLNTRTAPATFTSSPESEIGSYTRLPGLMSIGMYHNGTGQDNAVFNVYRSDSIKDNTDNNFSLVKNKEIYANSKFDTGTDYAQEQNMEGVDVNGDGFDEIATVRLSRPMYVELYDTQKFDPTIKYDDPTRPYIKLGEWKKDFTGGANVSDLEPNETMGYMALTAGDFDGDGCEELAVYNPTTDHPAINLLKYLNGSLKEITSFRLEDVSGGKGKRLVYKSDGNKLPNNGLPIVSLSTTSISGKDQIVFNASLPMKYDGYDNRSCMAILDYDDLSLNEVYSDDLTYDNGAYRMRYASATDGDLYGDGEQTLIVGGYKNDNLGSDSTKYNTKQGSLNGDTNLVQIIKYNAEENKYERGELKTAKRHSNGLCKMDKNRKITNPMAIAAVNFTNSANAPEFLFLGGKVFKWSDDDALAEKWEMPLGGTDGDDPFIVKAFAMRGINGNYMQEQLFVIHGDTDKGRADHDYMHTHTIININNAGKADGADATIDDVQLKDNYVSGWTRVDEDDDGDFCTAAPLQCNGYGATIRCTDKSIGWSDITVEAVLQSVPYWEELTYGEGRGQSSFTISSGKSTGKEHEVVHSNGGFAEVSLVFGFELFHIGGNAGLTGSFEGHKNHGNSDGKEYAISDSLTINSHAGSDTAVLSATAIGHYLYEVYLPEHIVTAAEHEYMAENYEAYGYNSPGEVPAVGQLSKPYTTPWINHVNYGQTYSSIEVNKFNDKVQDYYDAGGSKEKLGKIDMSKYNSAVIGDAYSYPADKGHIHNYATQQEYSDLDGNTKETEMIFMSNHQVTVNSNADIDAEIEIEFEQTITSGSSSGFDVGGTAGLTGNIDFLVGEAEGALGYSGEREENTVYSDSTITGKSFGVQVCSWEDYTEDGDNSEVPGNKYDFNVAPVVLKSLPLSNGDTPFILTYAVTPMNEGHVAPAIPDDIHVNTVSASALNVTWKNNSTPERPVSQYEIFQRNVSAKEDTFVSVGTVDATASSFLATNLDPGTTYAYKVRSIYDGTYSVCSSEAQGTTLPLNDSGPSFTKHPDNAYVKEADVSNGTTVTFDALAIPASKDHALSYQWQKLEDSGTEGSVSQWVNLSNNTESNPTAFSGTKTNTLSVALNAGNAEALNGAIFRVIAVEEGLGTARSQAVSRSAQLVISDSEPIKTSTVLKMTNAKDAAATVTDVNGDPVNQGKVSFFLYKRNGEDTIAVDEQATVEIDNGTASYTFSDKAAASESNYGFFAIYTDDTHTYSSSSDLVSYNNVVQLTADEGASIKFVANEGEPEIDLPAALFARGADVRFKVDLTSEQYCLDSVEAFTMTNGDPIELSEQDGVYSFIMPDESVTVNAKTALIPKVKLVGGDHGTVSFADEAHAGVSEASFASGSTVEFTVTPDSGYDGDVIVTTEDGIVNFNYVSGGNTYAFTMPDKDVTVTVVFEIVNNLFKKFRAVAYPPEILIGETSEVNIIDIDLTPMTLTPSKNYTVTDMNLYSSDESIATVDAYGKITGIAEGRATITARLRSNPSIYDDCTVTVVAEKPTDDPVDPVDDNVYEIASYAELCQVRDLINSNYAEYGAKRYKLTANIMPESSSPKWTSGIGSESQPFNGEFNGDGYCIVSLRVSDDPLFNTIGENGFVHDVNMFDTKPADKNAHHDTMGGIANVNNGVISDCLNGNHTSASTVKVTVRGVTKNITASDYNCEFSADICGGIAAVNNGIIVGSRNEGLLSGGTVGGIAGQNNGTIYAGANNVNISGTVYAGGIAGQNGGTIEASYNSHEVSGNGVKGSIAGSNEDEFNNVFAQTNATPAAGEGSKEGSSVVSGMNNVNNKFDETLNSVTEDTYNANGRSIPLNWLINANLNHKYPIIEADFSNFKRTTVENTESMTLRGTMHKSTHLTYSELTSENELYSTILDKLSLTGDSTKLFHIAVTDGTGIELPTGIWMNGQDVEISMPVSDADAVLMGIDADGEVQTFEPVSYDNGVAVYKIPALMQVFAVQTMQENPTEKPTEQPTEETNVPTEQSTDSTEKTAETPTKKTADTNSSKKDSATSSTNSTSSTSGTSSTTTGVTSVSGSAVQTGASFAAIIALIILAMSALIIGTSISKRRKDE